MNQKNMIHDSIQVNIELIHEWETYIRAREHSNKSGVQKCDERHSMLVFTFSVEDTPI